MTPTRQDIEALLALAEQTRTTASAKERWVYEADMKRACSPEVVAAVCRRALEADVAELKVRLLERTAERNALCPDHRDKGTGDECIVCKFERSATREAANGVRRQAFDEAIQIVRETPTWTYGGMAQLTEFRMSIDSVLDRLAMARDRAPEDR